MNKRILAMSFMIVSLALYLNLYPVNTVVPLKKAFADFPLKWKAWEGREFHFDNVILDKLRVSEYIMREYRKGNGKVTLYIGYYDTQKEGAQIHSPKHCLPGGGWFKLFEEEKRLSGNQFNNVKFVSAIYKKGNEQEIFTYWYKMKNLYITNEYLLKFYMIINSLRYRRNDAAFIRFSAPVVTDTEEAALLIEEAMKDFLPLLNDYLPE